MDEQGIFTEQQREAIFNILKHVFNTGVLTDGKFNQLEVKFFLLEGLLAVETTVADGQNQETTKENQR